VAIRIFLNKNMNKNKAIPEEQSLTEKILLQLADFVDFRLSYTYKRHMGIDGRMIRKLIPKKSFEDKISYLRKEKFIEKKIAYDGSVLITLTEKGVYRALKIKFNKMSREKKIWDEKWRLIAFDIPENCRKGRNALRYRMKIGGFFELQKSLFIYPYDCKKEIEAVVKLFKLEKYVRFALIDFIDNEDFLKRKFKLK